MFILCAKNLERKKRRTFQVMISDYWAYCIHRTSSCLMRIIYIQRVIAQHVRLYSLSFCLPHRFPPIKFCTVGGNPFCTLISQSSFQNGVLEDRGAVRTVWRGSWFGWDDCRASHSGRGTINRANKERGHIAVCQRVRHHQQSKQRAWSYSCVSEGETPSTE